MSMEDGEPTGIQSLARSKHIRICVYGDPGVGKTDLVGSSPGPTLIIRPPQDHTDSILQQRDDLKEWVVRDWGEMDDCMEYLRQEGEKWSWVWLDSASIMQDVLLDDIWDDTVQRAPHRKDNGLDKREYGINFHRLGIWFRHVVGADLFNFGWTAHPMMLASPDLDEDGDPIDKLMPWVQGKQMPQKFCGYMNIVAWIDKEKGGKRYLKTISDEAHYAKDQFDALEGKKGKLLLPRGGGMPRLVELIYQARPHLRPSANKGRTRARRRTTTRKGRK